MISLTPSRLQINGCLVPLTSVAAWEMEVDVTPETTSLFLGSLESTICLTISLTRLWCVVNGKPLGSLN